MTEAMRNYLNEREGGIGQARLLFAKEEEAYGALQRAIEDVDRYERDGTVPSGSVRLILENNLWGAMCCWEGHFDVLWQVTGYVHEALPRYAYGSVHAVHDYVSMRMEERLSEGGS